MISVPPADQTVTMGDTVGFTVLAGGSPPLSYQWNFDGAAIPDATDDTLICRMYKPIRRARTA